VQQVRHVTQSVSSFLWILQAIETFQRAPEMDARVVPVSVLERGGGRSELGLAALDVRLTHVSVWWSPRLGVLWESAKLYARPRAVVKRFLGNRIYGM